MLCDMDEESSSICVSRGTLVTSAIICSWKSQELWKYFDFRLWNRVTMRDIACRSVEFSVSQCCACSTPSAAVSAPTVNPRCASKRRTPSIRLSWVDNGSQTISFQHSLELQHSLEFQHSLELQHSLEFQHSFDFSNTLWEFQHSLEFQQTLKCNTLWSSTFSLIKACILDRLPSYLLWKDIHRTVPLKSQLMARSTPFRFRRLIMTTPRKSLSRYWPRVALWESSLFFVRNTGWWTWSKIRRVMSRYCRQQFPSFCDGSFLSSPRFGLLWDVCSNYCQHLQNSARVAKSIIESVLPYAARTGDVQKLVPSFSTAHDIVISVFPNISSTGISKVPCDFSISPIYYFISFNHFVN